MIQVRKDMNTKDLWDLTHQRLIAIKEGHNVFSAARMALDELCQREDNTYVLCSPALYGLNLNDPMHKVLVDRIHAVNDKVHRQMLVDAKNG